MHDCAVNRFSHEVSQKERLSGFSCVHLHLGLSLLITLIPLKPENKTTGLLRLGFLTSDCDTPFSPEVRLGMKKIPRGPWELMATIEGNSAQVWLADPRNRITELENIKIGRNLPDHPTNSSYKNNANLCDHCLAHSHSY